VSRTVGSVSDETPDRTLACHGWGDVGARRLLACSGIFEFEFEREEGAVVVEKQACLL
jgi:hypothetical protein